VSVTSGPNPTALLPTALLLSAATTPRAGPGAVWASKGMAGVPVGLVSAGRVFVVNVEWDVYGVEGFGQ
jgi:hypothetical protein